MVKLTKSVRISILCIAGISVLFPAVAQMRQLPVTWLFKELAYRVIKGQKSYDIKFGPQVISTNACLFAQGDEVVGRFVPFHAVDYRLVIVMSSKVHEKSKIMKKIASHENEGWTLKIDIEDRSGKNIKSFQVTQGEIEVIDIYCSRIELELGRIFVDSKHCSNPLSVKVRCVKSSTDELQKDVKSGEIKAGLCCELPFYPLDM